MGQVVRSGRFILALIFAMSSHQLLHAANLIWTNTAGGNWSAAANWSPNQVPTPADNVFITNAGNYTVTLDQGAAVANLTLGTSPSATTNILYNGAYAITVADTITVRSNGWLQSYGTISVTNRLDVQGQFAFWGGTLNGGGLVTVQPGARLTADAWQHTYLYNPVDNAGTMYFYNQNRNLHLHNTVITNRAGALIDMYNGSIYRGNTNSALHNFGLIQCSGASSLDLLVNQPGGRVLSQGTTYLYSGRNHGILEATYPSLFIFYGASVASPGTEPFYLESGTELRGDGELRSVGTVFFNAPVSFTNTLTVHTYGTHCYLNANLTNYGQLHIRQGSCYVTNPAVTLRLKDYLLWWGYQLYTYADMTNAGTILADKAQVTYGTLYNGGQFITRSNLLYDGGTISGPGRTLVESNATATVGAVSVYVSKGFERGVFENRGVLTFNSTGGTGPIYCSGGARFTNAPGAVCNFYLGAAFLNTDLTNSFVNFGSVTQQSVGAFSCDINFTNYGTLVSEAGRVDITRYTQLAGQTLLQGGDGDLGDLGGVIDIQGGTLRGSGSIVGSLQNAASLQPGRDLGLINVTGPFTNTAAGTYQMQLGGNAASQYDRITGGGTSVLSGTLNVTFTNGFYPTIGNTFTALTYTARSGQFDQILTPNYQFEIVYLTNALVLRASNALPVVSFTLSGGGNTQLVCNPFQLTASATDLDGTVTNLAFYMDNNLLATAPGNFLSTTVETDFPGTNHFEARALDDRSGAGVSNRTVSTVTLPLHVLTLGGVRSNSVFKVCMVGETGSNYVVLASTNIDLPPSNWTTLGLMENTNGIWRYFDNGTITNRNWRFYRALQQ